MQNNTITTITILYNYNHIIDHYKINIKPCIIIIMILCHTLRILRNAITYYQTSIQKYQILFSNSMIIYVYDQNINIIL